MPRQLTTSSGRTRGSWTPRLAGIGAAVLVASGGVAAYLVASPAHAARRTEQLPTRVASVQTVGIVAQPNGRARLLRPAGAGLRWGAMPAGASQSQGDPQWTADTMAGGTMVFIYVPSGQCLASVPRRHGPLLALRRCDLDAAQRWQELGGARASQRQSAQYRNLASRRCLMAGGTGRPASPAVLAPCATSAPGSQLISFWWGA
jgi:hypothetical protein